MQNVKLTAQEIDELVSQFTLAMTVAGDTKKQVQNKTGLTQSQVSRISNGLFKSKNKSVIKICSYAESILGTDLRDITNMRDVLVSTVLELWDGTASGGQGIISILQAMKQYRGLR